MKIDHPFADNHRAPLYAITFPASPGERELLAYVEAIRRFAREIDHPVVTLVDFSQIKISSPAQRNMLMELEKAIAPAASRYLAASAIVAPSKMLRGLLKAAFWLQRPVYPYKIFQTRAQAEPWALARLP